MNINRPEARHLPGLRQLWKEAFGDTEAYLDIFFSIGFSPDRCRCITDGDQVQAALYWFDCTLEERKLAYLYAIATARSHRGRGFCQRLLENTHAHLASQGYAGALLVPAEPSLFDFYGRLGYRTIGTLQEHSRKAAGSPEPLRQLSPEEYALLRRQALPSAAVLQEGATLAFLAAQGAFYAGEGLLLAALKTGSAAFLPEYLGDPRRIPGVLKALGAAEGTIRTPGGDAPFAMGISFTEEPLPPTYFAFALD